ncbi:hypothetical protein [Halobacillus naozhouensis]|uniref:Uncharacterized protein n=1 Tax=Halobacillus naozhouensis TaxID=554880 RepID=A0ABY8IXE1_9BACI|nr:hypothetical protein [Halobacillus naozhouensis]WFT74007.1 hypothetical protein P9989_16770 [Halobacillus naozhouensis]
MRILQLVTIGVLVVFLFVVVHNNLGLRDERKQAEEKVNALQQELKSKEDNQIPVMTTPQQKAVSIAERFVHSYFGYTRHPVKEEVETYVTDNLMKDLTFQESKRKYAGGVKSTISDLTVYYGMHTSTTQSLFFTFNNRFTVSDVTSTIDSYLRVEIIKENDKWKVNAMSINQF